MNPTWTHETERYRLARREDIPAFVELLSDPEVGRWLWFTPIDAGGVEAYFGPLLDRQTAELADALLAETLVAAKRSHELSVLRYQEGFSSFQRVLDAQRQLFSQQERWVNNRGAVVSSLVGLYTALGGGWELDENDDFVSETTRLQMQDRTDWGGYFEDDEADDETE